MTTGTSPEDTQAQETVRRAGRGGLAVAVAKVYFILVGFLQQIAFKAILGLDGYGALSSALAASSISYNPITQASIQGVSREVAAVSPDEQPRVLRRALGFHTLLACLTALLFFAAANPLAHALGAPHIAPSLRILSSILFFYGIYTPLVGALNGLRRFVAQAALDMLAATLRTIGLIGGAYLGARGLLFSLSGPESASLGFAGAGALILLIALVVTGLGQAGGQRPHWKSYFTLFRRLVIGQLLLNLLFQADALLLRRFAAEAAELSGLGYQAADPYVGAYRAAQLFGFLPYQLLMSVTFILFPFLATAHAQQDHTAVREYVRSGIRLALLLAGLLASVLLAVPHGLIALALGQDAAALGAPSLQILAIGLSFLAVLGVMTAALNSLGQEKASLWITACALLLVVVLCGTWARGQELGPQLLTRTAWATSSGLLLACLLAARVLARTAGGVVATSSLLRVTCAVGLAGLGGARLAQPGVLGTLLSAAGVALAYLLTLLLTRELHAEDARKLQAIFRRNSRKHSAQK